MNIGVNFRLALLSIVSLWATVCYSQDIPDDSVSTGVNRQLSEEEISRAKTLATRGIGYYTGRNGYTRDFQKAYDYLMQAAELNNSDAECVLAHMYENGNGVEQDYTKAAEWYRKAADKNVVMAQNSLGYLYDEGLGVEQSFIEAAKWYRKAADNNNASAQYNIADMLVNGIGVEKDLQLALEYYKKARTNGIQQAASEISKTERLIYIEQAKQRDNESGGSDSDQDYAVISVEQQPVFPGGNAALLEFLRKNVKYPAICRENNIQGRVIVSFIIDRDGSIQEPQIVKSVNSLLDQEALRVISIMPSWEPGLLDGKPVRVKYSVPINFRLN